MCTLLEYRTNTPINFVVIAEHICGNNG